MVRAICDHVSWVPLTLALEPTEVINPDDGKKKTVYCLHLKHEAGFYQLIEAAGKPKKDYFIAMPADDEAPRDKELLTMGNGDNWEEFDGRVEDDTDSLFGAPPPNPPTEPPKATASQPGAAEKGKTELSDLDKLILSVREKRKALVKDIDVLRWLAASLKVTGEEVKADPKKAWEGIRDIIGMAGKEL